MIVEFHPYKKLDHMSFPEKCEYLTPIQKSHWILYYKDDDAKNYNTIILTYDELKLFLEIFGYQTNSLIELQLFGIRTENIIENKNL